MNISEISSKRAHASRQRHERVAQLDHLRLALAHGVAHDKLGQVVLGDAGLDEESGFHADDGRPALDSGARHGSHEPDRAAAVHKGVPRAGDPGAQVAGGFFEMRIVAEVRPAVHGDVHGSLLCGGFNLFGESPKHSTTLAREQIDPRVRTA